MDGFIHFLLGLLAFALILHIIVTLENRQRRKQKDYLTILDAVTLTHISMPNTPAFILYHGRNTGKDKAGKKIWTRIGAVWPNKSGNGF